MPNGDFAVNLSKPLRMAVAALLVSGGAIALAPTAQAATIAATWVKTTNTGAGGGWNPPSPDPSGITYNSRTGKLIISDGEVEETNLSWHVWQGTNLWEANLDGSIARSGLNTKPWSNEPTGVGFRPQSTSFPERLFVSDDDQARIFEVNAVDGVYGNGNDTQTSSSVSFLNLGPRNDAEDVAVDLDVTRNGRLFLVDGKGKRAFVYNPGPDKVFNGVGDFVEQTFNLGNMGAGDPEGIAYNAARDTVFVLDDPTNRLYEVSLTGALLNTVTLPFTMKSGAGLAFAPPSDGGSGMNAYIVDRGVDNNTNGSTFNDGRLFEVAIPGLGGGTTPPANQAPVVNAGPDVTLTMPASGPATTTLTGSVTDDGQPAGAAVTQSWTGAGVTFGSPGATTTTASFPAPGTYVVRLTASDTQASAFDEATVTVNPAGTTPPPSGGGVIDAKILASTDDAEQVVASGAVMLASGDLNLPLDGSRVQMAGMRFSGVGVPQNATITKAYVQFQADEVSTGPVTLDITGELANDAAGFTTAASSISSRAQTAAAAWSPVDWGTLGARTAAQQADVTSVVQAVVSQPGWAGSHLVLIVKRTSGSGNRVAESFDGGAAKAPVLHIEYTVP